MSKSMKGVFKSFLPDRVMPLPILTGPFRRATVYLHPRHAMRKVLGVYEHELNSWLAAVLPRVNTVIDIGANEGYFTFGSAAAFRRLGKLGEVLAYEPEEEAFEKLQLGAEKQKDGQVRISIHNCSVGVNVSPAMTTLNEIARQRGDPRFLENTLIKMDVEGAEIDVIAGASEWLVPSNYFLIEVHEEAFLSGLTETLANRGLKLNQINQEPLPVLGYEVRSRANWWLVSDLS
jgi:methyltransferase FkbM-like protein